MTDHGGVRDWWNVDPQIWLLRGGPFCNLKTVADGYAGACGTHAGGRLREARSASDQQSHGLSGRGIRKTPQFRARVKTDRFAAAHDNFVAVDLFHNYAERFLTSGLAEEIFIATPGASEDRRLGEIFRLHVIPHALKDAIHAGVRTLFADGAHQGGCHGAVGFVFFGTELQRFLIFLRGCQREHAGFFRIDFFAGRFVDGRGVVD